MNERQVELAAARKARAAHVVAWRESGLTQAAYCANHQLNATTFSGWIGSKRVPQTGDTKKRGATGAPAERNTLNALNAIPIIVRRAANEVKVDQRPNEHQLPEHITSIAPKASGAPGAMRLPVLTLRCTRERWQLELSAHIDPRWVGALLRQMSAPEVDATLRGTTTASV
jgi:hypothetical protein